MKNLKTLLKEYLTDEQRDEYSHVKMNSKARERTDKFFGKNNDEINVPLDMDAGHLHHKSEVHKAVERHLGKELTHKEYHSGLTLDKYNRPVKIGKQIADPKLRDSYASDKSREGAKLSNGFTARIVRGVEVAGQTNPAPNKQHPVGHSWQDESCKNIEDGSYNNYLPDEISRGTVVHFVKDHTGKEIYRATLQPHHSEHADGEVVYHVNSEYGVKHPAFTASAHKTAVSLSDPHPGEPKLYKIDEHVYNDKSESRQLHPSTTAQQLDHIIHSGYMTRVKQAAYIHHNLSADTIHKMIDNRHPDIDKALANPAASADMIDKAVYNAPEHVKHVPGDINFTPNHLMHLAKYGDNTHDIMAHPNTTVDVLRHIRDTHSNKNIVNLAATSVLRRTNSRAQADAKVVFDRPDLYHTALNVAHDSRFVDMALNHPHPDIVHRALERNIGVTGEHLTSVFNTHPDLGIKEKALTLRNAPSMLHHNILSNPKHQEWYPLLLSHRNTRDHTLKKVANGQYPHIKDDVVDIAKKALVQRGVTP